jgi:hypothetical protein
MNTIILTIIATVVAYVCYRLYIKPKHTKPSFQKLILIRHGEKPSNGLGNLDCKGLNRSLALPQVLLSKFGKPDYIFAPNPARKVIDHGIKYNYIRPLVTIEPTAIKCNLPINSDYGLTDIEGLLEELSLEKYKDKIIFVAWEHKNLDKFAKLFSKLHVGKYNTSRTAYDPDCTQSGSSDNPYRVVKPIPDWPSDDFDSIFIFWKHPVGTYLFSIDHEELNDVSDKCPV